MKWFFGLCIPGFVLVLSCGPAKIVQTDPENVPSASEEVVGNPAEAKSDLQTSESTISKVTTKKVDFSSAEETGAMMNFLASDELKGRNTGGEGIEKAANFIADVFKANDIAPYFSTYKDTLSNFAKQAYNIVGVLEGTDEKLKNEYVIVGAHYDHIGEIGAVNGDSIANGANDNASGTTTVLELARYFGKANTNKRSIIFALFSAEEQGLLGSVHLAKKLKARNIDLYTVLNFEMVGVPLKDKDFFMHLTGYEKSNLAEVVNRYSGDKLIGFLPSAAQMNLFQRSDNYPFHLEFNVPSQTFHTFDFTNFDHYHQVSDEVEIVDFEHMAEVINRLVPVLERIVNAPTKEIKFN